MFTLFGLLTSALPAIASGAQQSSDKQTGDQQCGDQEKDEQESGDLEADDQSLQVTQDASHVVSEDGSQVIQVTQKDDKECLQLVSTVFNLLRGVRDPEKEETLEDLCVVREELVSVRKIPSNQNAFSVEVLFVPTVPHCSLATLIGLCMRIKIQKHLAIVYKLRILVKAGTHDTAGDVNKQINDKERVAAAMENPSLMNIVDKCISYVKH